MIDLGPVRTCKNKNCRRKGYRRLDFTVRWRPDQQRFVTERRCRVCEARRRARRRANGRSEAVLRKDRERQRVRRADPKYRARDLERKKQERRERAAYNVPGREERELEAIDRALELELRTGRLPDPVAEGPPEPDVRVSVEPFLRWLDDEWLPTQNPTTPRRRLYANLGLDERMVCFWRTGERKTLNLYIADRAFVLGARDPYLLYTTWPHLLGAAA